MPEFWSSNGESEHLPEDERRDGSSDGVEGFLLEDNRLCDDGWLNGIVVSKKKGPHLIFSQFQNLTKLMWVCVGHEMHAWVSKLWLNSQ